MGRKPIVFHKRINFSETAAAVGKMESEGPLKEYFDLSSPDSKFGMETWEKAEAEMVRQCSEALLKKSALRYEDIDLTFSGDLTNQCAASAFGLKSKRIPHIGLYGACSTFVLSLGMGGLAIESGLAQRVMCEASSHFCSAERQYRFPLEYGCQRPPSAQSTVTGSGTVLLENSNEGNIRLAEFFPGIIRDPGICDANNMGAAMAASCADTLIRYFDATSYNASRFDLILTGDLGFEGHHILLDLCKREGLDLENYSDDCGKMIYSPEKQEVNSGGSGCGCSAVVFCSYIMDQFRKKKISDILLIGTGALLNATTVLQKESIPGVSHLVRITREA